MNNTVTMKPKTYPFVKTCPFCGNTTKINVPEETMNKYYNYNLFGGYIQEVPVNHF